MKKDKGFCMSCLSCEERTGYSTSKHHKCNNIKSKNYDTTVSLRDTCRSFKRGEMAKTWVY